MPVAIYPKPLNAAPCFGAQEADTPPDGITDIQFGSIMGLNGISNGFLDVRIGTVALRSRLTIPGHHDYLPRVRAKTFEPAFFEEMAKIPEATRPGILYVTDPDDYVSPELFTWNTNDPKWAETSPLPGRPQSPLTAAP